MLDTLSLRPNNLPPYPTMEAATAAALTALEMLAAKEGFELTDSTTVMSRGNRAKWFKEGTCQPREANPLAKWVRLWVEGECCPDSSTWGLGDAQHYIYHATVH